MKAFLHLIRFPNLVLIVLSQALVQACLLSRGIIWEKVLEPSFGLLTLSTVLIAAAGYIINDYYDVKIDAINKPERMVVGTVIRRRRAMFAHLVLSFLGIAIGFWLYIPIGLINTGAVFLLWGYSARLKKLPLIGNITIALLSATMLLVVAVYDDSLNRITLGYALFAFLISLIREIIKDIEDMKGDASFECRTLPIVLGIRNAKLVLYPLIAVFLAFAIIVAMHSRTSLAFDIYMLILVLLPAIWLTIKLTRADRKRDFTYLSNLNKFIMLTGILSMLLVG
ncbi:geranylgeranylglycerol-phosphate geranylgeranyltransferase [Pontibacter sp. BT310]|uniref:Geranylgeranylglycerol-phosphate geranylgeranyltransferase n=1 Tax=Pontibacter populi TaxID=890055 RepID=A0ABS6X899_9BACT|nr:geranylgeranylglycerol-phosphate geranylgeranyltransferase [Pontibacter populi]MBJ6117355.1 geranylgeranylglycerol-phosphate geranylgeranyltransferase [Pontibacter sp. BT310]MBR0569780.1 geranylgeranylglycerol-phosphate geranylgeranyltransferase [Microvirga sp. STS03]MBW3364208.1 geranylgeranylglycerol-phosphate geranylgeranyltransferase [Pontibacter populi]